MGDFMPGGQERRHSRNSRISATLWETVEDTEESNYIRLGDRMKIQKTPIPLAKWYLT